MTQHPLPPAGRSLRPGPNVDQVRRVLGRFRPASSQRHGRRGAQRATEQPVASAARRQAAN